MQQKKWAAFSLEGNGGQILRGDEREGVKGGEGQKGGKGGKGGMGRMGGMGELAKLAAASQRSNVLGSAREM